MDIDDVSLFADWETIQFDQHRTGWSLLVELVSRRTKNNKVWQFVQKINQIKDKYKKIINLTNEYQQKSQKKAKGKGDQGNLMIRHNSGANIGKRKTSGKVLRFQDDIEDTQREQRMNNSMNRKKDVVNDIIEETPIAKRKINQLKTDLDSFD